MFLIGNKQMEIIKKVVNAIDRSIDKVAIGCMEIVRKSIVIEGSDDFKKKVNSCIDQIEDTESGRKLLRDIWASGKVVTIKETAIGNSCGDFDSSAFVRDDGSLGSGSSSTINFNPDRTQIGSETWEKRPPAIGLAHELVHAAHAASGSIRMNPVDDDNRIDASDPSKIVQQPAEEVRTVGIYPYDGEPYSENSIRSEWGPVQPSRPWY